MHSPADCRVTGSGSGHFGQPVSGQKSHTTCRLTRLLCFSCIILRISCKMFHVTVTTYSQGGQNISFLSWQTNAESTLKGAFVQHLRPLEVTWCAAALFRVKRSRCSWWENYSLIGVIYLTGHKKLHTVAKLWHGNWNKSPYPFLMAQYHWELNGPLPLLWAYQWFITLRLKCNSNRLRWIIKTTVGNLQSHICEEMERGAGCMRL